MEKDTVSLSNNATVSSNALSSSHAGDNNKGEKRRSAPKDTMTVKAPTPSQTTASNVNNNNTNTSASVDKDERKSPRQRKAELSAAAATAKTSASTSTSSTTNANNANPSSINASNSNSNFNSNNSASNASNASSTSTSTSVSRAPSKPIVASLGDSGIAKPTNAVRVVHVERDAISGGLVLVQEGMPPVALPQGDPLAAYAALLQKLSVSAQPLGSQPQPQSALTLNTANITSDEEGSDSSDDRAPSPRLNSGGGKTPRSPEWRTKEPHPNPNSFNPSQLPSSQSSLLRARDERDARLRVTPALGRFSSPYVLAPISSASSSSNASNPMASARFGSSHMSAELSESDTTIEEETRRLHEAKRARRDTLIAEFVRTEASHVEALKGVIVDHVAPLRESRILTSQQQKDLFSNIELILTWNMDFLQALKDRLHRVIEASEISSDEEDEDEDDTAPSDLKNNINNNNSHSNKHHEHHQGGVRSKVSDDKDKFDVEEVVCFGDIIVKSSVILRQLFAQYNQNYAQAQLTYAELLKRSKDFEQFVAQRSQGAGSLLTALYLPIQRMIVYDALLKEILLLTSPTHPDYAQLSAAYKLLRSMDKAAMRVAEKRKNLDTVLRIQATLGGSVELAQPHRSYVFEERLLLVVGKALKERVLYLFNDLLLLVKEKKKHKCEVERSVALDKITLADAYDDDRHLFKLSIATSSARTAAAHQGHGHGARQEEEALWFHSENKLSWLQLLRSTQQRLRARVPAEIDDLLAEEHDYAREVRSGALERELLRAGAVPLTRKLLQTKIVKWSLMDDADLVLREVRKLARRIVREDELRQTFGAEDDDSD